MSGQMSRDRSDFYDSEASFFRAFAVIRDLFSIASGHFGHLIFDPRRG
jgi:hypothetical protein